MKAGVLGVVDEDFPRFEPYRGSRRTDGQTLTDQIDITGVARTGSGIDINVGIAAREDLATRESVAIEFDEISFANESNVVTRHTRFAGIPGELLVVENSSGLFLYDILERAVGVTPRRVRVDLDGVLGDLPETRLWKVGFYDRDEGAANGVLHGENLQDDPAFAQHLDNSAKNQLGLRVTLDDTEYNVNITESGYFEIYEPRDLDTDAYLQFIRDYVQPNFVDET